MTLVLATDDTGGPEIFASVQGEGPSAGEPTAFMRLSRCNLACVWCDTAYTWHFDGDERPHRSGETFKRFAEYGQPELMRQIAATKCRYVRCIRPNDEALAMGQQGSFDRIAVVEQLRCCGVLAALRVARAGYPDRKPLRAFVERFAVCLPGDGRSSTLAPR